MSQFDSYTQSAYLEKLRIFLDIKKQDFLGTARIAADLGAKRKGRLPNYPEDVVKGLEAEANAKAARCEASDVTLGERLKAGRDYKGLAYATIAKQLDVSRELVRCWCADINRPTTGDMRRLAVLLNVPELWLLYGGEERLPANSHIGVRVGNESLDYREQLHDMTIALLVDIQGAVELPQVQAHIEHVVMTTPRLARVARRAGGRWQAVGSEGGLLFAPWVPIVEHGLSRRYWPDEVEAIIDEELSTNPTVYKAWHAVKRRCEEMDLTYPKMISLHKRVTKERERVDKFGVDLNAVVIQACKCSRSFKP